MYISATPGCALSQQGFVSKSLNTPVFLFQEENNMFIHIIIANLCFLPNVLSTNKPSSLVKISWILSIELLELWHLAEQPLSKPTWSFFKRALFYILLQARLFDLPNSPLNIYSKGNLLKTASLIWRNNFVCLENCLASYHRNLDCDQFLLLKVFLAYAAKKVV